MGSQLKRVQITCVRVPSCDYITETGFSRSQSNLSAILNGLEETQKITKVPNVELSHNWPDISQFLIKRELLKHMTLGLIQSLSLLRKVILPREMIGFLQLTRIQQIFSLSRESQGLFMWELFPWGLISLPQHFSSSFPVKQYSQYNEPDWAKPS